LNCDNAWELSSRDDYDHDHDDHDYDNDNEGKAARKPHAMGDD